MYRSFHDVTYLVTSYKEPPLCVSVYAFELYKGATSPYRHTLMSDQESDDQGRCTVPHEQSSFMGYGK